MSQKAEDVKIVNGNPGNVKGRRSVVINAASLEALLTDHANAERLLDSWCGK
jgi:hypothetical protein